MAQFDAKTFEQYERRITALEAACLTEEEREINRFVIRIIRSVRSTLWLINGAVKYFAAPIGFLWAIWAYGANAVDWLVHFFTGHGR